MAVHSNDVLKVKFQKLHTDLLNLNLSTAADELFQEGVISADDYRDLLRLDDPKQKAKQLLALLHTSQHPQAFIHLRAAVQKERAYEWFVERLDGLSLSSLQPPRSVATLVHKLPKIERCISGVSCLDGRLFVLYSNANDIDVYDTTTYSLLPQLSVPELRRPVDLASCPRYCCLYVSDDTDESVHRLELLTAKDDSSGGSDPTGSVSHSKWSVDDKPESLSVNKSSHTILVSFQNEKKLKEFTTFGKLLRKIYLQPDISFVRHSVLLQSSLGEADTAADQFIVCHGSCLTNEHRVCKIDTNGRILQVYGGQKGSAPGQLYLPYYLAFTDGEDVDGDGSMLLVADSINHRVVLLSLTTLNFVREVVSRDQLKWTKLRPEKLYVDVTANGRRFLYVTVGYENAMEPAGRVFVFRM